MELGPRIKELRESAGLNQVELAKILRISNTTLSQYESGARVPGDEIKKAIADYFDVSLDYLYGRTEQKEIPTPVSEDGLNEKDVRLVTWFRSLPPEKQKALLIAQDGPVELAD